MFKIIRRDILPFKRYVAMSRFNEKMFGLKRRTIKQIYYSFKNPIITN